MAPDTSASTDVSGKAQAVAGTAKDRAADVSSTATDQASQVASTAADEARQVGRQAVDQAQGLLSEARRAAWDKGEESTGQLAGALGRLRDQANALIEGRPDEAGPLRDHGRDVVDRLDTLTRRLEANGLQGTVRDLQSFARRRPAAFLAGAGLIGFAAGRLVRAGRDGSASLGGSSSGAPTGVGAPGGYNGSGDYKGSGDYNGPGGYDGPGDPMAAIPPRTSPASYPDAGYPPAPSAVDDPTQPLPPVPGMAPPPPPPPLPPTYLER